MSIAKELQKAAVSDSRSANTDSQSRAEQAERKSAVLQAVDPLTAFLAQRVVGFHTELGMGSLTRRL
jgi:hypothetical protein